MLADTATELALNTLKRSPASKKQRFDNVVAKLPASSSEVLKAIYLGHSLFLHKSAYTTIVAAHQLLATSEDVVPEQKR